MQTAFHGKVEVFLGCFCGLLSGAQLLGGAGTWVPASKAASGAHPTSGLEQLIVLEGGYFHIFLMSHFEIFCSQPLFLLNS